MTLLITFCLFVISVLFCACKYVVMNCEYNKNFWTQEKKDCVKWEKKFDISLKVLLAFGFLFFEFFFLCIFINSPVKETKKITTETMNINANNIIDVCDNNGNVTYYIWAKDKNGIYTQNSYLYIRFKEYSDFEIPHMVKTSITKSKKVVDENIAYWFDPFGHNTGCDISDYNPDTYIAYVPKGTIDALKTKIVDK